MTDYQYLSTRAVHAGRPAGIRHGPLVTPIVQSTTYLREDVDSPVEHAYSRVSNPTVDALERQLGSLEDAPPAVCFSSGLAAETALFLAILKAGDHVVCGRAIYGGTQRLLEQVLSQFGVEGTFVDSARTEHIERAIRPETKLVFVETPGNPTLALTDIAAVAEVTHHAGAILAVDNTFLTAVLQRPLDLGADISVYSTTKITEGHSAALGGALCSRDAELLGKLRFIRKSTGGIQTPFNAWLTLQGVKTLPLRIREQSRTAEALAKLLSKNDHVAYVNYPGLPDFPQADLASRQHDQFHGQVLSFELVGGAEAARHTLRNLRLCSLVEHVGGLETLATHSASMTHADVSPEQRHAVGVTEGLIRISAGLEDVREIADDLEQAIAEAHRGSSDAARRGPWVTAV